MLLSKITWHYVRDIHEVFKEEEIHYANKRQSMKIHPGVVITGCSSYNYLIQLKVLLLYNFVEKSSREP